MRIKIKQHDITDCGAACLASVAAHYGLVMPIAKIRQIASTDKKGTNVLGLTVAAEKLGFSAKRVKSLNADGTKNLSPLSTRTLPHLTLPHRTLAPFHTSRTIEHTRTHALKV